MKGLIQRITNNRGFEFREHTYFCENHPTVQKLKDTQLGDDHVNTPVSQDIFYQKKVNIIGND